MLNWSECRGGASSWIWWITWTTLGGALSHWWKCWMVKTPRGVFVWQRLRKRGWEANLTALNPLKSCQLKAQTLRWLVRAAEQAATPRFWWRLAFGNQRDHNFFSRWKCFAWTLIICMTNLDQSSKSLCSMPFQMASWSHFEAGLFSQWSQWTKNFQQKNQSPKSFQTYDFLVGFLHKGSARGWKGERGIRVEGGKKKIDGEMAEVFDCLL